jgi:hypothetical protein
MWQLLGNARREKKGIFAKSNLEKGAKTIEITEEIHSRTFLAD